MIASAGVVISTYVRSAAGRCKETGCIRKIIIYMILYEACVFRPTIVEFVSWTKGFASFSDRMVGAVVITEPCIQS